MNHLRETLLKEIEEYREQGKKFLNKEINVAQFKKLSGGMGSYAQRGGNDFMVRLRVMSGVSNTEELKTISQFAKDAKIDNIHLTTRQAIQLHSITIDDVCEIMKKGLDKELYTRGAGGNFPRNVALSPLAGVEKEEAFDVTAYALEVNKYFLNQITSYKLPRKLKVSFSGSKNDGAHCTVSDLGFIAKKENGEEFFEVYAGGGLGRNPELAVIVEEKMDKSQVLYYVEAMVRMFIAEGDWENHGKARVRYMLKRLGKEAFIETYKKHLKEVKESTDLTIDLEEREIVKKGIKTERNHLRLVEQKQEGLYSVYFHPIGGIVMLEDLDDILNLTENMEAIDFRLSMDEGMYIRNLNGEEAEKILDLTMNKGGETSAQQSVSCIGATICQIGVLDSHGLLNRIVDALKENNVPESALPRLNISGCPNSCGVHEIGTIGLAGKKKRVNDETRNAFEVVLGGRVVVGGTKLGKSLGDVLEDEVINMLLEIAKTVENSNMTFKSWIELNENDFDEIVKKYNV